MRDVLTIIGNGKEGLIMIESFGRSILELSDEDMKSNPQNPVVRLYDDNELIGKFSLTTLEVVEDIDLADYDIKFAEFEIKNVQKEWLDF